MLDFIYTPTKYLIYHFRLQAEVFIKQMLLHLFLKEVEWVSLLWGQLNLKFKLD